MCDNIKQHVIYGQIHGKVYDIYIYNMNLSFQLWKFKRQEGYISNYAIILQREH